MEPVIRDSRGRGLSGWALALALLAAGCGAPPDTGNAPDTSSGGLSLPPGFVPVALPEATRKEVFAEVHRLRARSVREANAQIPMDEASLPYGDKVAFDKRVADHKALIDAYLDRAFAELAARHKITEDDLQTIEDEARMLRWLPPQDTDDDPPGRD